MIQHEVHLFCTPRSRKLTRLKKALPDLRLKLNCDPHNTPAGSICYEYPAGREAEFEEVAESEGIAFAWGLSGFNWLRSFAVGDYLYAIRQNAFAIWFIGDPELPVLKASIGLADNPLALFLYDSVAYVTLLDGSLLHINIDDPTAPTVDFTVENAGQIFTQLVVIGDVIIAAGTTISLFTTDSPPRLISRFTSPGESTAQIDVQGRRIYFGDSAGDDCSIRSYRWGGFFCHAILTGALEADEVRAEAVKARHGYFYGEIVASSIGAGGSNAEQDTGVIYAANYVKLGQKFIFQSETVADPNTLFTAPRSSLFLASDGTVWRNTTGAAVWVTM